MLKKISVASAALFCALNLYSLSVSVNSSPWEDYSRQRLDSLAYAIAADNGEIKKGISLAELFPALFDAWLLEVECSPASERVQFEVPDLADKLEGIFLSAGSSGWELEYEGLTFSNINSINIKGEVLTKRPLEIWVNWEGTEFLRGEIKRYADLHRVEIKVTEVPRPDSKLISVARGGGAVPDILMVQSGYIDSLVRSGSIQNIGYMYPEGLQVQGREAFTYDGKIWAVPFYYDAQLMFYNPEMIHGPDYNWTLSDYEKLCRTAGSSGSIASAWNAYSASFLIPFQLSFGKQHIIEPDGSIRITDEASRKALEYIIRLKDASLMTPMERDAMTSLFVSGDAAMIISASYAIPHFQDLGIPFETVPLPVNQNTGIRVSPLLDFKAFAITKKSRNTAGARRLIEYLTGTGVQYRFTSETSKVPALESAFRLLKGENKYYEALRISAESGTIIPTDKAYSVYKNTMWKMLRFAISGRMPPGVVLEKTQELVDKNMEDIN
ncbi:MAG: extracellular solute-binding protein [Spirochaetales bacterium]|nr:extracellular solute-binding protein [Spirochaetales bacterium]